MRLLRALVPLGLLLNACGNGEILLDPNEINDDALGAGATPGLITMLFNNTSGNQNALPWAALLPRTSIGGSAYSSQHGYPVPGTQWNWPVSMSVGDIDQDGELDVLMVMEQRLIMAVGFHRQDGRPTSPYLIWARFDPSGSINKVGWGRDFGAILWDVNPSAGDGLNEVAVVIRNPQTGTLAVALLGGAVTNDNGFGGLPAPSVLDLDDLESSWRITQGQSAVAKRVNVTGGVEARDIMVVSTGSAEPHIWTVDNSGQLSLLFKAGWHGPQTHSPYAVDVDGDGKDEVLSNGVLQFNRPTTGQPPFGADPCESWQYCFNGNDHADALFPFDHDNDGDFEILMVHDYTDKLIEVAPTSCNSACSSGYGNGAANPIWDFANAPAGHGQDIVIGEFLVGADAFQHTGKEYIATPKGAPFYNGGGPWGSYLANGTPRLLAANLGETSSTGLNGPTGWTPRNIQWDGDFSRDEVFSRLSNHNNVFELVPNPDPNLRCQGNAPSTWSCPYVWRSIMHFRSTVFGTHSGTNKTVDLLGDEREEILVAGRYGFQIAFNDNNNAMAGRSPSPWVDADYQRRMHNGDNRPVDYQAIGKLESLTIDPATVNAEPFGPPRPLRVVGHYAGGHSRDVTHLATLYSANDAVATIAGAELIPKTGGYAALRAELLGVVNNDAALAHVSADPRPVILYAGYTDSYINTEAGTLTVEARIADPQDDVAIVSLSIDDVLIPEVSFNDQGVDPDNRAGDGTFSAAIDVPGGLAPGDVTIQILAMDQDGNLSDRWPYLIVEGDGAKPVPGFPSFPFPSEDFGAPPPVLLAGTGLATTRLEPGDVGVITLMARYDDAEPLDDVGLWFMGNLLPVSMNDAGHSGDQLPGDGLWTVDVELDDAAAPGVYLIEMIPHRAASADYGEAWGDVFPRARVHAH